MNKPACTCLSKFLDDHKDELLEFVRPNQFSRTQHKIELLELIKFMLFRSLDGNANGYEIEALGFFPSVERRINKASFCKARQKVHWEAFEYLLSLMNCEEAHEELRWHGHFVRAIDGAKLVLPNSNEIKNEFPCFTAHLAAKPEHYPRARLVVAANVFTQQITHAVVGPLRASEREQVRELIKQLPEDDVLLLDRGLDGIKLWDAILEEGQNFVARLRVSDESDQYLSHQLLKTLKTDLIVNYQVRDKTMRLRLLRSARRQDGSCVVVATNLLDQNKYSRSELINLYKRRWQVEKAFLWLKQNFLIQNFHSRKLNSVMQEIFVALVNQAWVAEWLLEASAKLGDEATQVALNFKAAVTSLARNFQLIFKQELQEHHFKRLLDLLLAIKHRLQPGRSYPRTSYQPLNRWSLAAAPSSSRRRKYNRKAEKFWKETT